MKTKTTILRSRATEAFMELNAVNGRTIRLAGLMLQQTANERQRAFLMQLISMNRAARFEVATLLDGMCFDSREQLKFWEA